MKTSVVSSRRFSKSAFPVPFTLKAGWEAWAVTISSRAAGAKALMPTLPPSRTVNTSVLASKTLKRSAEVLPVITQVEFMATVELKVHPAVQVLAPVRLSSPSTRAKRPLPPSGAAAPVAEIVTTEVPVDSFNVLSELLKTTRFVSVGANSEVGAEADPELVVERVSPV